MISICLQQIGLELDHLPRELENDGSLVSVVRGAVNFAVHDRFRADEMRERDRGDQRGLAVLARHREDRAPHRAPAALIMRLVDVADEVALPIAQLERLALALAARDRELFDEVDDASARFLP